MNLPEWFIKQVKSREGFRATPYNDAGHMAIGYGSRALPGDKQIDEAEATRRLTNDLAKARQIVEGVVPKDAPDGVRLALTSLTQNAGSKWVKEGLGDLVRDGNYAGAQVRLQMYTKSQGKELPGLVTRRQEEARMMQGETPRSAVASRPQETVPPGAFTADGVKVNPVYQPGQRFGNTATANAKPFSAIVAHHTGGNLQSALATSRGDPSRGGTPYGYHFYIDEDGAVHQGAPLDARTNHVQGPLRGGRTARPDISNSNAVGIAFVGDGSKPPSPAALASAQRLTGALQKQYNIPTDNIVGHGEIQGGSRSADEGMHLVRAMRTGAPIPETATAAAPASQSLGYAPPGQTIQNEPGLQAIAKATDGGSGPVSAIPYPQSEMGAGNSLGDLMLPMVRGDVTTAGPQEFPSGPVPSLFSTENPSRIDRRFPGENPLMSELSTPGLQSMAGGWAPPPAPSAAPSAGPGGTRHEVRPSAARPAARQAAAFTPPDFQDQWNTGGTGPATGATLPLSPFRTPAPSSKPPGTGPVERTRQQTQKPAAAAAAAAPVAAAAATPPSPLRDEVFEPGSIARRGDLLGTQEPWSIEGASLSPYSMGDNARLGASQSFQPPDKPGGFDPNYLSLLHDGITKPTDEFGAGWPRQETPTLPWPTQPKQPSEPPPMAERIPRAPELAGDLAGPATPGAGWERQSTPAWPSSPASAPMGLPGQAIASPPPQQMGAGLEPLPPSSIGAFPQQQEEWWQQLGLSPFNVGSVSGFGGGFPGGTFTIPAFDFAVG